mgnify:CR=1 FL=1
MVFPKLNAMLSVAKEAADKVIQAALRADKNAAAKFNNLQTGPEFAYRLTRRILCLHGDQQHLKTTNPGKTKPDKSP